MADRIDLGDKPTDRPPRGEKPPRASRASSAGGQRSGGGGSGATAAARPTLRGDDKKLHDSLTRFYNTVGVGMASMAMMRGDANLYTAGVNIGEYADETADAWIELAQQNDSVKRLLNGFVQGSAIATLVGAHAAMVLPVMAARGVVPPTVATMVIKPDAMAAGQAYMAAQQQPTPNGNTAPPTP